MNTNYLIGIIFSLLSSFFWAAAVMFFRHGGKTITSFSMNVGKNLVGIIAFAATIPIIGETFLPAISSKDLMLLTLSGIFGVGLGDLLFLSAVNMLGAGLNSIVGSVYTPFLVLGAFIFLGEPISLSVIIGGILVVTAIIIIAGESVHTRPKHLYLGIFTGITGMIFTVFGILLMKDLLIKYNLFWINLLRIISGMIFYFFYFMIRKDKAHIINSFKSLNNWFVIGMAGFLGSYLAIFFWTACLSRLPASVVAVVNQLAIVVIIIFAAIFLKEKITKRKGFAAVLAIVGAFFAASNLF